jgi:hypothetical protein
MKPTVLVLVISALIAASPALAQGVSNETPGQRMQSETQRQKDSHPNSPGASYYAPGHEKNNPKVKPYEKGQPGASGYAPGHSTTGSGSNDTTTRSK